MHERQEKGMLIDLTLKVTPEAKRDAEGHEMKALSGHLGTHFDVMDKEFPLDFAIRRGIIFDVSGAGEEIALTDIEIDRVEEDMFVLFYTGFIEDAGYGTGRYAHEHPFLAYELIDALLERKVSLIGIDFAGIRRGKEHTPADRRCADHGTFIIENLCNLKELLPFRTGFAVYTFPVNFSGMSGLPCRVTAKITEGAFAGKVAVVTGGAHGIGLAIREAFEREGCLVEVIDIRQGDHYVGDISVKDTLESFASYVIGKHGRIDYLINNALPLMKGIDSCSYEEFQNALAVGVTAPFYLAKLFRSHFASGAAIVNISSSRDRMSQPQTESYTAAKGGIAALTHALAVSFAGKVRVNSVSPGWIDTDDMTYEGPDAIQQPAGRVGNRMDIANMVLYLCSDKAGFITGENICIDGGMTRQMIYHGEHGWTLNIRSSGAGDCS